MLYAVFVLLINQTREVIRQIDDELSGAGDILPRFLSPWSFSVLWETMLHRAIFLDQVSFRFERKEVKENDEEADKIMRMLRISRC